MPKKREKLQKIMEEKFILKWDHFHSNASKSFSVLRNADYLHDVTLVSDDHNQIWAHKLVLSACSEYFKDICAVCTIHIISNTNLSAEQSLAVVLHSRSDVPNP